jgi:ParB family chromosome partitioning protein
MNTTSIRHELDEHRPLQLVRIPLNKLRVHPQHIRTDLGDVRALADSLKVDGQHQPIEVHRRGTYVEIVDGSRRFTAAGIAGLRTLQGSVVPARTDAEVITAMLTTGVHTRGLSPEERAAAVTMLLADYDIKVKDLAARCGVTPQTVRNWRDQAQMPDARSRQRTRRRRTTVGARKVIEVVDRWSRRCGEDGFSRADALELLGELRELVTPTTDARVSDDPDIAA